MAKKFYVAPSNSVKWSDPEGGGLQVYEEGADVSHLPKDTLISLLEAASVEVKEVKDSREEYLKTSDEKPATAQEAAEAAFAEKAQEAAKLEAEAAEANAKALEDLKGEDKDKAEAKSADEKAAQEEKEKASATAKKTAPSSSSSSSKS